MPSSILRRSVLTTTGDVSAEYPAGNAGNNGPGAARVSLAGSWAGGVILSNSLGDGEWVFVKLYAFGPEDDIATVCAAKELFRFEAAADFVGEARVIVSQGEVIP
ncbi:MAG: hypothetical protein LBT40_12525 [Deltaproteobacteria bacterium]|jgi:hypothetical protein|nr:hypothetical protein [Deltaproteobacteria bacterium]